MARQDGTAGPVGIARRMVPGGVATLVVAMLLVATGVVWLVRSASGGECRGGTTVVTVDATPDMAPVISQVALDAQRSGACWRARVSAVGSGEALADLERGDSGVDVWIPDSTTWVQLATTAGVRLASVAGPIATSPVVLALPETMARQLGWPGRSLDMRDVLATGETRRPAQIGWPDPALSAPAVAALLGLEHAARQQPGGRTDLAGLMSVATTDLSPRTSAMLGHQVILPVTEQSVWAYNATSDVPVVAAYSSAPGTALDYPYVVVDRDPATTTAAAGLLAALDGSSGQSLLASRGFRDATGQAASAVAGVAGLDTAQRPVTAPATRDAASARALLGTLRRTTRMLAVVDVSGSMGELVPGTDGKTRLALAVRAAASGLALLPAGSEAGLWEFSTDLEPGKDYRELVPIGSIAGDHKEALAQGLAGLQPIPNGSTGLYDSILAAVKHVRATYDPTRTNAVVVLTDGANDDPGGLNLAGLLDRLRRQSDPRRPVPVIAVAYGPQSDAASLRAITDATGGETYVSVDPRQVRRVLLDAIGQRLCRPHCRPVG